MSGIKKITMIGVGNRFRSDDGAGVEVLSHLRKQHLPDIECLEANGEGGALISMLAGPQNVYLFDAVFSGAAPGTIFRFDAKVENIPANFFNYSTHAFSVAEAIETARALGQLPDSLIVFGVEGKRFAAGMGLSEEVRAAVERIAARVVLEIRRLPV